MDSYTWLAHSYDRLTADVDYSRWADYLEWHFGRQAVPVRTVVELACGTGSLTRILAERGYEMTAVDLSADMLSFAAQKCQDLPVLFLCQDMSRLTLLEQADAVVCCLDSVNYVTRPAALRRAFQRVYRYLKPGGLFLFDAKTPQALEEADGQVYLDETEEVYCGGGSTIPSAESAGTASTCSAAERTGPGTGKASTMRNTPMPRKNWRLFCGTRALPGLSSTEI